MKKLLLHKTSGFLVDPVNGVVYGKKGRRIGFGDVHGYTRVSTRANGKTTVFLAHRVVWEAAQGDIPQGMQINHKNGLKRDNRISNLEVVTPVENVKHAFSTGLCNNSGESNARARLTEKDVLEIRRTAGSITATAWARKLGVSRAAIGHARTGYSWRRLSQVSRGDS